MEKHMTVPAGKDQLCQLKAGDYVYLTGTIYTARDAAHKRMNESLDQGEKLPVKLEEQVIIIWDHLRQEKEDQSVQQDQQLQAEWISMRRGC